MTDPTETREVGRTGVRVTRVGLGGGPFGMARVSDEGAWDALETAWAGGVRYFDTAPWYGRGLSEHRVGRFLRSRAGEPYVISTKVGRLLYPPPVKGGGRGSAPVRGGPTDFEVRYDYSGDGILRSHEDSLQRLGLTSIDMAIVHDLDLFYLSPQARMDAHIDKLLTSGWPALQRLKDEGVVKAIGFGINDSGLVPRWLDLFDPDFFLVAGPYTLMEQTSLHELDRCAERQISVIIGTVLGGGLLATGPTSGASYRYAEPTSEHLDRARRLQAVCQRFDTPLVSAALRFPLGHPAVAAVIPGAKDGSEVDGNLRAFRRPIPGELWRTFVAEGLLASDVPTPTGDQG